MNAPAWSEDFQLQAAVEQFYADGADEALPLADDLDTIIIPLGAVNLSAFPGTGVTELVTGSMLFVPVQTCRAVEFIGKYSVIVIKVSPAVRLEQSASSGMAPCPVPHVQVVESPQQINAIVQLVKRMTAAGDACTFTCKLSIARLLLWELGLGMQHARVRVGARKRILDRRKIRAIDRFVEDNLEEPLSLEQLAAHAGMSRYYFLRSFKEATGQSPLQYVIAKRVERARTMLSSGPESIAEIAYATGFSSQSHLNWAFKRHFGVTPGAFKRQHRMVA